MTPLRIIGIGSSFGDDRIGWEVLDALKESGVPERFPAGWVTLHYCDAPVSLPGLLAGAGSAILVDAMHGEQGSGAGTVRELTLHEVHMDAAALSNHRFGVAESLALGRELGMLPRAIILFGIELEHCDASRGVSVAVRAAVPGLVRRLENEVRRLLQVSGAALQ